MRVHFFLEKFVHMHFLYYLCSEMAENKEIERKFLVKDNSFLPEAQKSKHIVQGYLSRDPERTIRVRICDACAFLTIKSSIGQTGITRFEWEKEINETDARELLELCEGVVIDKTRYIIPTKNNRKWEVDVFHSGKLNGKVLAEIELESEEEPFERPAWLGEEVTGQPEYYNSNM